MSVVQQVKQAAVKAITSLYQIELREESILVNATKPEFEGAKPSGFSIDFAKLMNDEGSYQLSSAYPQKGFSFSYFNYGTKILGEGYIASYFIQPNYRINNRLHVQLKGAVGLGYLTNPFDSINNPTNKNYSQYVTPYLQLGIGLGYRLSQHFTVSLATNFHHLSNGSNHQPNSGLNYTTTALSINYFPNTNELKKYGTIPRVFYRKLKPTLDIGLLYVPEQGYNYKLQAERQYTFGLFAQLTKQIGRTSALSIGAEAYHNEFENITNAEIKTNPYLFAGIYGGHEFIIGKIIFSQQIGFYITPHSSYFSDSFYLSRYVVFQETSAKKSWQLVKYLLVVMFCVVLNYGFLKFFFEVLKWKFLVSKILTTAFVVVFSYLSQRNFTFKAPLEP